mgnify:FL=1
MKLILLFTIIYSLFPLLFYWIIKRNLTLEIKPILPFVILSFVGGIYEFVFTFLLRINSVPWFYTYDFLSFFTIQYFFYIILGKERKQWFRVSSLLYFLLFVYLVFSHTMEKYMNNLSYLVSFLTLLILIYALIWFKRVFMEVSLQSLSDSPTFYFVSGFLFYYTGVLVLFLFADAIYKNERPNFQYYWLINLFFNIFHKTLLILGMWKARKEIVN